MGGLILLLGLLDHIHQAGGLAGVCGIEGRGDEGQGYALILAEEMAVLHDDGANHSFLPHELVQHDAPQVQRVHGHHLGVVTGFVFHDQVGVLYHLGGNGVMGGSALQHGIPGRVHKGREMLHGILDGAQAGLQVQGGQDAGNVMRGRIPFFQDVAKFLYGVAQQQGIQRVQRIAGSDLDKDFVGQLDIAEGNFGRSHRPRQEFHDVLFIAKLGAEEGKNGQGTYQAQVHEPLVRLEKAVYGKEDPVHFFSCKILFYKDTNSW